MKKINVSDESSRLGRKLQEFSQAGKVFQKSTTNIQYSPELEELKRELFLSLSKDLSAAANIEGPAHATIGEFLASSGSGSTATADVIVYYDSECRRYYAYYDTVNGACYDLGSQGIPGCVFA